jgi:hypothetical protein
MISPRRDGLPCTPRVSIQSPTCAFGSWPLGIHDLQFFGRPAGDAPRRVGICLRLVAAATDTPRLAGRPLCSPLSGRATVNAIGDDQPAERSSEIRISAATRLAPVAHKPGLVDLRTAIDAAGTTNGGDPGRPGGVLGFDRAQADQSSVLIHSLDRVAVQLQLADNGCRGVNPSRAQRGKRDRLFTGTMQLLERQTMLSLNERHQIELSTLRPRPIEGST